ncbi:Enhanced intracellular survival protein [Frondihabitans sp. 762G35]|uniref:GNAT family N-acetyltransferase n=1 Tax=Frondihabitans sp. 762G35 TaxID=1446794 RepID=UPI000D21152C|nr:GNAT family N-acetyltransferase [Frondihabitans sp. 762G35]ARC58262.1 Enhanced intracellular survival protein [Frondihabitans sp. 762G35]
MSSFDETYDLRTFDPVLVDGAPDAATAAWIGATRIAFHQSSGEQGVLQAALGAVDDGRVFTGVYAKQPPASSLDADWPVGTYAGFTKTINVGGSSLVPSYLISDVTVRPTHKRRGMLRHLMTDRLAHASATGHALAALTASESTIYRRFGFGPSVRQRSIVVRRDRPFGLHAHPAGRVELASAHDLAAVAREVFAAFHARTPGSVDRHLQLWNGLLGLATDEGKPDESVRAAVHYAEGSERVDGYVVYRIIDADRVTTLQVVDLVAGDANAHLALWEFLGRVDLVDRITHRTSAVDNAVLHALVDSRSLETLRESDHIWLRVLDPVAALEARPYPVDGSLTLRLHDALGYADGVFTIDAAGGSGRVSRAAEPATAVADLELDVATLASLYLGGVSVGLLAEAGLVTARDDRAVARATAFFAAERPVYCITDF